MINTCAHNVKQTSLKCLKVAISLLKPNVISWINIFPVRFLHLSPYKDGNLNQKTQVYIIKTLDRENMNSAHMLIIYL